MKTLQDLRQDIDAIDDVILDALAKRFARVDQVSVYKKEHGLPPLDPQRWEQLMQDKKAKAHQCGLNTIMIEKIWDVIHEFALASETEHMKK